MSPELPAGTVTFLFTDIEGSTKLVARVGDQAYEALLATERDLVVGAAMAAGGVHFGSEGDAHFVAFASAAGAVRGAVAAQRALAAHPWPGGEAASVRMGVHAGEVRIVDGDYVGYEVHRAARVASAAYGGQILVSGAARALAGDPGDGITLRDLGEHPLKDVAIPERLFQVDAPGLRGDFPPPRSTGRVAGNLPTQLTSFVGRAEVDSARALLDRTRLLTLTGPGGTGKTRLSLELASDCAERFPDGAWFVPLAAVRDPELVASGIAASLGLLSATRPPIDNVREHLRDRHTLLVLDNLEQVLDAAPVVADLLRAAPGVTVVASSRAPLRVTGEQEFPVPPLSLPAPGARDAASVAGSEAGRLFEERARAVRPAFAITAENAADVAEIVRRLDGLPLAIELAAARIRLLSPAAMARRLDDRAADGGRGPDAAELLERLAEQSLLRIEEDAHGDIRFAMLETIREYAEERLESRGEGRSIRDRHAAAVLALVEAIGAGDAERGASLDRLDEEHDNIRAALDHLVETGDTEMAAALAFGCWRFWHMRGHIVEGRRRVDRILAMSGWTGESTPGRLHALEAAGGLAYWGGDMTVAGTHYAASVLEARRLGDDAEIANALYNHWFTRRPTDSFTDWTQLIAADDRRMLDEALEIWTRLGDELGIGKALWGLGEHYAYRGDHEAAEEALSRALAIFEARGDQFWIAWARFTRSFSRSLSGDLRGSADDAAVALREFRLSRDVSGLCLTMSGMSSLLLLVGRQPEAFAVAAAAQKAISETGLHIATLWPNENVRIPDVEHATGELAAAVERGRAWTREQALDEAIRIADEVAAAPAPTA